MEDKYLKLIDKSIGVNYNLSEILRSINAGLLCVQHSPDDRPCMSAVVQMLGSECALPQPKQPVFSLRRKFMKQILLQAIMQHFQEMKIPLHFWRLDRR